MFFSKRKPPNRTARRRANQGGHVRRGVATVELAICLPVLLLLTIGTIDMCSMLFLRETITLAAYEGAREGVGRGHTNSDASTRVEQFLNDRGVQFSGGSAVQISAPGFDGAATLQNVTVTVTVPCAGNLLIPSAMFSNMNMSAQVTMRKEYENLNN